MATAGPSEELSGKGQSNAGGPTIILYYLIILSFRWLNKFPTSWLGLTQIIHKLDETG